MKNQYIAFTTILFAVGSFVLLPPEAFGVVPAPDGGYPGFNTAEGQGGLFSLTTGIANTAVGWFALKSNAEGNFNTATGAATLLLNTGDENTATGAGALLNNSTGQSNTANGAFALFSNTEGFVNTASGNSALYSNTTGSFNTANGASALFSNTTGASNTATGDQALFSNTTGGGNAAFGRYTLSNNTEGQQNTAIGFGALSQNSTGIANTATGSSALSFNTIGSSNTADGSAALYSNSEGNQNTATGYQALLSNRTGENNTATGFQALYLNQTGYDNTAYGWKALSSSNTGSYNTAVGYLSLNQLGIGSYNVAVAGGFNLTSGDFNIDIGNDGIDGDSGVIRIGSGCCQTRTFIAGIWNVTASGGASVYVNSDGQLGTATSSARFKQNIQDMDKASEALLALRPVTFRYKPDLDPNGVHQFGLVAEEVADVNPDLVVRDKEGKPYTVRYEAVNAMLLNEFLKEHKKVEEQQATIVELKSIVAQQGKDFETAATQQKNSFQSKFVEQEGQIKALALGLQKVSAQIETSRSAPQMASLSAVVRPLPDEGGNNQ
jgi:hypothetical protein